MQKTHKCGCIFAVSGLRARAAGIEKFRTWMNDAHIRAPSSENSARACSSQQRSRTVRKRYCGPLSLVQDVETGRRGFVLIRNDSNLAPELQHCPGLATGTGRRETVWSRSYACLHRRRHA